MEAVFTPVSPKHNQELRQLKRTLFRPYFGIEMDFCLVLFFALLWVFGASLCSSTIQETICKTSKIPHSVNNLVRQMFSYGTEVFKLSTKPLIVFTHLAVCKEVACYPLLYHWAFKSDLSISETL